MDFGVGEDARGSFGGVEDSVDGGFVGGLAVFFEPEENIGFAAHGADFDDLVEAEEVRGYAGIDNVGEFLVAFAEGFDDGGGVDAGGGAEGIVADDGIVGGNCCARGGGNFFAIFLEAREIAIDQAKEPEIYEHEFHRRVAHAFAQGVGGSVDAIRACG